MKEFRYQTFFLSCFYFIFAGLIFERSDENVMIFQQNIAFLGDQLFNIFGYHRPIRPNINGSSAIPPKNWSDFQLPLITDFITFT